MSNIAPEDAAREGAKFLDAELPGWFGSVDLSDLAMNDCALCILGQVYGYYEDGLNALDLTQDKACELGFDTDDSYEDLDEAWYAEVVRRYE